MDKRSKRIFLFLSLVPILTILIFVIFFSFVFSFDFSRLLYFYILNIIYIAVHLSVIWRFLRILNQNIQLSKRTKVFVDIILYLMGIIGFIGLCFFLAFDLPDYRSILGFTGFELHILVMDYIGFLKLYYENINEKDLKNET